LSGIYVSGHKPWGLVTSVIEIKKHPHFRVSMCLHLMHSGDLRVVTNCGVLTEGFDAPVCDTIVMCRPTLSKGLYLQVLRHSHSSKYSYICPLDMLATCADFRASPY
jgi:predicted helicase